MSRRRYLSPSFWDGPTAQAVSPLARLLLLGCWTTADDDGLLVWDAALLREIVFAPDSDMSDDRVAALMSELVAEGSVHSYRAGAAARLHGYVVGFERTHTTPRPRPSTLPPPPCDEASSVDMYAARACWTCHLCEGSLRPLGAGDWPRGKEDLMTVVDLLAEPSRTGDVRPRDVAVAHGFCRRQRAGRPVEGVRTDSEIVEFGRRVGDALREIWEPRDLPTEADNSVSPALPGSPSAHDRLSESGSVVLAECAVTDRDTTTVTIGPTCHDTPSLTCGNTETEGTHPELSEPTMNTRGALTTHSPTEREMEREREIGNGTPLSASRSGNDGLDHFPDPDQTPTSICAPPQPHATTAEGSEADPHPRRHLSLVPGSTPTPVATDQNHLSGADGVLDHDSTRPQGPDEQTTAGDPMTHDTQDVLFEVPAEELPPAPEKKKRKQPSTWTPDRKDQAHAILKPWWETYGTGWAQSYGVVFGVIVAALANKVTPEDITRAMQALGQTRKPVSGGTIAFALANTTREQAEERAYEQAAASRDASKYTQRTM